MDSAKAKLGARSSYTEVLPDNEVDFEKQKAKEVEKQRKIAEAERIRSPPRRVANGAYSHLV